MKEIPSWCLHCPRCPLSGHNDGGLTGVDTSSVWDMLFAGAGMGKNATRPVGIELGTLGEDGTRVRGLEGISYNLLTEYALQILHTC